MTLTAPKSRKPWLRFYLRLNGYFCLGNYLHHMARVQDSGLISESDVLAIRMPEQEEVLLDGRPLPNDSNLVLSEPGLTDCIIAEVKTSKVKFNKPITRENGMNVIKGAMKNVRVLPRDEFQVNGVAHSLAADLHKQVRAERWPDVPRSVDEKYRLSVSDARLCSRLAGNNQRKCLPLRLALDFE